MTQDEIIAMAKEARISELGLNIDGSTHLLALFERFAALVEAKERDECAKACESLSHRARWVRAGINGVPMEPCQYAAAIRARSAKGDPHG